MDFLNNLIRPETYILIVTIIFWFVVVLIPLVAIHEFGHLLFARLFGVRIPEYGIGMPLSKRRFWFRWKGIIWSFYPWLLGGFVRIYGDHDALDDAWETNKTDPVQAKREYVPNRLSEIMQAQELQFFLEENSLEMDARWQWYEIIYAKQNKAFIDNIQILISSFSIITENLAGVLAGTILANLRSDEVKIKIQSLTAEETIELQGSLKKNFDNLTNQLETLILWEFEAKFNPKNPKALNNAFFSKNWIQQTLIIAGGIIFNLITAFILLMILFGITGGPIQGSTNTSRTIYYNQIEEFKKSGGQVILQSQNLTLLQVVKDSAADKAGLKAGDEIVSLGSNSTANLASDQDFVNIVQNYKDQTTDIVFKPKGESSNRTTSITPQTNNDTDKARLGVAAGYLIQRRAGNPVEAVVMAWNETGRIFNLTWSGLKDIGVALLPQTQDRSALDNTGGPVAVGRIGGLVYNASGIQGIIYLMAAISISLAIFNMLPIPALDGGRFILLTLSKIFGKRNKQVEAIAISATFLILMGLAVLIAGNDIRRIFIGVL